MKRIRLHLVDDEVHLQIGKTFHVLTTNVHASMATISFVLMIVWLIGLLCRCWP